MVTEDEEFPPDNFRTLNLRFIRGIAAACRGVGAVKTTVVRNAQSRAGPPIGYELSLVINSDTERVRTDLQSRFRSWLRPNELPCHIHITQALDAAVYKQ